MIIWLSFLFPFQDKPQTYLKVENYINRFKSDSVDISTEKVGLGISRNIYGYYGFMTHHILEYDANNDNYSKGIIYKNWLVGHSINSWGNHSFMLGRLFVVKQKYLTSRIFAEFKFSIAVASGYEDGGNLPGSAGLMLGFVPSLSMGYRLKPDIEACFEFIYIPTPYIGVINLGFGIRKALK